MKTNKITKMMMIITMIAVLSLSSLAIYGEGYNVVNLQAKNRGSMTTISGNLYDKEGHRMRVKTSIDVYCNNTKIGTTMSTPDDFSLSVKKDVCPVKSVVKVVIGDYTSNEATVRKVSSSQPPRPTTPVVLTCEDKQTQCLNNAEKEYTNAVDACNEKTDGAKTFCLMTAMFNYNQDKASCGIEKQKCDCSEKEGFVWFFGRCVKDRR